MGFPVGYTELLLPKPLMHTLSLLGFIRKLINTIFRYLGLPDFTEPDFLWSDQEPVEFQVCPSVSSLLIRESLPVVKFSDLVDAPDSCAVCLYDFEDEDEVRRLTNCRHIFHRSCLDRWMGYDQKTCPLCRTPLLGDDDSMQEEDFNESLWDDSAITETFGEFLQISGLYQD